jgi:hypothetical protein
MDWLRTPRCSHDHSICDCRSLGEVASWPIDFWCRQFTARIDNPPGSDQSACGRFHGSRRSLAAILRGGLHSNVPLRRSTSFGLGPMRPVGLSLLYDLANTRCRKDLAKVTSDIAWSVSIGVAVLIAQFAIHRMRTKRDHHRKPNATDRHTWWIAS